MTGSERSRLAHRLPPTVRHWALVASAAALLLGAVTPRAADQSFSPEDWLRQRKLSALSVTTPQSGKPLQPIAAGSLEEWKRERQGYAKAYRELIGPWPAERLPLKARLLEKTVAARWTRFKVAFTSLPGDTPHAGELRAWLFVPAGHSEKMPAIITLHQTLPQGKDEPAGIKASLPWLTFARYYAERGYVTLAPDMIGYGERTAGGYERTGFEWADAQPILDRHRDMTLLGLMLFDVSRCVDFLQARPEVDAERIGVMGHSLGGILTNAVLPLEPRLKVGVASCGYGLFRTDEDFGMRWAGPNSAYLPRLALYRARRNDLPLDFHHILALAAPRPHLIQTALGDTIWTLPAVGENAFVIKELRRVRSLYGKEAVDGLIAIEPGGGARDRNHGWYPETQQAADALFAKVLGGKASPGR
jgi:dienelactone hydrolase